MHELQEHKEDQFKFLMKFLHFNEMSIKIVINESQIGNRPDKQEESQKYKNYLILFVTLLCEL